MDLGQEEHRKGRYKGLADKALLACVILFAAATWALLRWPGSGWLVFLQSISAAAIVGGIADWYGVVSIYGRPLGISYRTEIVVQKRAQLVAAMSSFICDDLLSPDNINDKLQNYSLAERLLELFESRRDADGPFAWLTSFGSAILYEVAARTDPDELAEQLGRMLAATVDRITPSAEIVRISRWSLESGYSDRFLTAMVPGLQKIVGNSGFRAIVQDFARTAVTRYVGDKALRQIFMEKFLQEQVLLRAAEQVVEYLDEVRDDPHHPLRLDIRTRIAAFIDRLEQDRGRQATIDAWLRQLLEGEEAKRAIAGAIEKLKEASLSPEVCTGTVETLLQRLLSRLHRDPEARAGMNQWLLEQLSGTVQRHHDKVGNLAEASLSSMDNHELVQFIREGIENDLQLIRVNGMMFGMLIGMVVAGIRLMR